MSRMAEIIVRSLRERPRDWELPGTGGYYLGHIPSNAALWVGSGPNFLRPACNWAHNTLWPPLGFWDRQKVWRAYRRWKARQPDTFNESKFGFGPGPGPDTPKPQAPKAWIETCDAVGYESQGPEATAIHDAIAFQHREGGGFFDCGTFYEGRGTR